MPVIYLMNLFFCLEDLYLVNNDIPHAIATTIVTIPAITIDFEISIR